MDNIGNNNFKPIFLPLSTHFWEETNLVDPTYTFTLFVLFCQFSFHIQIRKLTSFLSIFFFLLSFLPFFIFYSIKQSLRATVQHLHTTKRQHQMSMPTSSLIKMWDLRSILYRSSRYVKCGVIALTPVASTWGQQRWCNEQRDYPICDGRVKEGGLLGRPIAVVCGGGGERDFCNSFCCSYKDVVLHVMEVASSLLWWFYLALDKS